MGIPFWVFVIASAAALSTLLIVQGKSIPWSVAGRSLLEALVVFVISNLAILVLVFLHLVDTAGAQFSFRLAYDIVGRSFTSTEIFVYVLALIAPALWVMFANWRARRHVIFYYLLLAVQLAIALGSAIIYAKAKSGQQIGNPDFVTRWAQLSYAFGLAVWYITMVYDKWLSQQLPGAKRPESGQSIMEQL